MFAVTPRVVERAEQAAAIMQTIDGDVSLQNQRRGLKLERLVDAAIHIEWIVLNT